MDRTGYIGSSDASVIFGVNPYKTLYELWLEKTGQVEYDFSGKHIERGNAIEPFIEKWVRENISPNINSPEIYAQWDWGAQNLNPSSNAYKLRYGVQRIKLGKQIELRHEEYPFIGGHPDGIDENTLWEFKASAMYNVERILSQEGIKDEWYFQVQHLLMITGLPIGRLALWNYDSWEPIIFDIAPDEDLHKQMIEVYQDFWYYVTEGIEPEPYFTDMKHHTVLTTDEQLDDLFKTYKEAYEIRYAAKDIQMSTRGKLLTLFGDKDRIITPNYTASVTNVDKGNYQFVRLVVKEAEYK